MLLTVLPRPDQQGIDTVQLADNPRSLVLYSPDLTNKGLTLRGLREQSRGLLALYSPDLTNKGLTLNLDLMVADRCLVSPPDMTNKGCEVQ